MHYRMRCECVPKRRPGDGSRESEPEVSDGHVTEIPKTIQIYVSPLRMVYGSVQFKPHIQRSSTSGKPQFGN
jgi:hypothetical protein